MRVFLINYAACTFWAAIYEKLVGAHPSTGRTIYTGGAVSALAYATDYLIVPKRLTPGFEIALPRRALLGIYGA